MKMFAHQVSALIGLVALCSMGGLVTGQAAAANGCSGFVNYCNSVLRSDLLPQTCQDLMCRGYNTDGVYTIYPGGRPHYSVLVYCDQTTTGGGWTVFQRRMDGTVDFFRNWANYKLGFGDVDAEHWLGNDKLHTLLSLNHNNELRVDMEAVSNERTYALYRNFSIGSEADSYRISISGFEGTSIAGNSLEISGTRFSTKDRDQDTYNGNCAELYFGGWWYTACHASNLNGQYLNGNHTSYANGVNWRTWKGYHESLKTTEMKFRAKLD